MRIVAQRVKECSIVIDDEVFSSIENGILVLLGIEYEDDESDIEYLTNKISNLRIFDDENGIMNLSVKDINGEILVVSQFTLYASTKKGNRPSYIRSAKPDISEPLYEKFVDVLQTKISNKIKTGIFGADMKVNLINNGPVTIIIDSKD